MRKKILCIWLASLAICGSFVACGNTDDNTPPPDTSDRESGTLSEETREPLEIPDTRYDGKELVFLTRGDEGEWTTSEIFSAGLTTQSDDINNAVFERNLLIQETYGITIREVKKNKKEHLTAVINEFSGNNGDFQAIVTNTANSASLASQGVLWDLNADSITYMDLSKPWWDQNMVENFSIHNRLHFATGDLLTADNDATYAMLFNKTLATNNKLPDLYELVEKKQWTMDTFYQYASGAVQEKDGQKGLSYKSDVAGFAYNSSSPYSFLFAGDVTICQKDENDYPVYHMDVERAQGLSELGKRIFDGNMSIFLDDAAKDGNTLAQVGQICFGEQHALFLGEVMQAVTRMRSYDVDFGILPYPMYDTAQGGYSSMMHQTASMVSIPKNVVGDELDMTTAMIEAMAYHSVDTLTIQYYEINLKTKGAKDAESGPMIDMILSSRACDLSYYYNWGSNAFGQLANTLLPTSQKAVASLNRTFSRMIDNEIRSTVDNMDKNADEVS